MAVFPTLLRLKNAHLKKLGAAQEVHFERQIGEVCGSLEAPVLTDFPSHLSLAGQVERAIVSGLDEYLQAEAPAVDRWIAGR